MRELLIAFQFGFYGSMYYNFAMKIRLKLTIFAILLLLCSSLFLFASQTSKRLSKWLEEVDPIISKAERSVYESLPTDEDKLRFQKSFWAVRDPDKETPENEFKQDYYRRLNYANNRLGGVNSDRGEIYMILGEPFEINNYTGSEQLIDCEVWEYRTGGRLGLPPFMRLLFYKPRNVGDFRLFYPGIYSAVDILSPGYQSGGVSKLQAYREIRGSFPQLAQATLSVIPGEGSPTMPATATSSNSAFSKIFSLPEKEAKTSYIRNFRSTEGIVDVMYSFKEIDGYSSFAISEDRGYRFLNYRTMPDIIQTRQTSDNKHAAKLNFNLKISDKDGKTIYQRERTIDLMLNEVEKNLISEQKAVFSDFIPIIPGQFQVTTIFSNKTTEEFYIYEEEINVSDKAMPVMIGYKAEEATSDKFMPFSAEKYKVFSDPRAIFNKTDSIVGMIFCRQEPEVRLIDADNAEKYIQITNIEKKQNYYFFSHPLESLKSGYYFLTIKSKDREDYKKVISVMPFVAKRPKAYEWSDPPSSGYYYTFELAQEYLNKGEIDTSLEYFNRIPKDFWNASMLPVKGRAYYANKDYARVIEILSNPEVIKSYSVLLMLGNSALEQKELTKAAEYFELLRKYGDTANINRTLGAIFLSLGKREKAKTYFDRADELGKIK